MANYSFEASRVSGDGNAMFPDEIIILFADIVIESRGGRKIVARGFTRDDADQIKELLSF